MTPFARDPALVLLAEIRDLLHEILDALPAHPRTGESRHSGGAALLAAIAAHAGERVFSAAEVARHAGVVTSDLEDAIIGSCGAVNARRIGKYLARIEGLNLGGRAVRRVGSDASGAIWRLVSL